MDKKSKIPEVIFGHPWYLYVDPEIDEAQLKQLTAVLNQEIEFVAAYKDQIVTMNQNSQQN
jgi:hypothetical protein